MRLFRANIDFFEHIVPLRSNVGGLWKMWVPSLIALALAVGAYFSYNWLLAAQAKLVDVRLPSVDQEEVFTRQDPFTRRDVDVVIAVDLSTSTCDPGFDPSDPGGMRLRAAEMLIGSLAADIFPRRTNIALLGFSDEIKEGWRKELISIENDESRESLMLTAATLGCGGGTDIGNVVEEARVELLESERSVATNIPALVLLTDGEPDPPTGNNTPDAIIEKLNVMTEQGVYISLVTLRREGARADKDSFREWRSRCIALAEQNRFVDYYEARQPEELDVIYNAIRQRLVREGAPPGQRQEYDPTDPFAHIVIPPNLLKAVITIAKTQPDTEIELVAPDGTTATQMRATDMNSVKWVGTQQSFYRVYTLNQPQSGNWTLMTPAPVAYTVNPESLYSARILFSSDEVFLNANAATQVQIVVVDRDGRPVSDGFGLDVKLSRLVAEEEGDAEVQVRQLPTPTYESNSGHYITVVTPDQVQAGLAYDMEVTGRREDGTLVNVLTAKVDAVNALGEIDLHLPEILVCDRPRPILKSVSFRCATTTEANLEFDGGPADVQPVYVSFVDPTNSEVTPNVMTKVGQGVYTATTGLLSAPGTYEFRAELGGTTSRGDSFVRRSSASTRIVLPSWIETLEQRLLLASVLLLVLGLWKPVIVFLLLVIFRVIGFSGIGFYSTSSPTSSRPVWGVMLNRRRLFGLSDTDMVRHGARVRTTREPSKLAKKLSRRFPCLKRCTDYDHSDVAIRAFPFGTSYLEDGRCTSVNYSESPPAEVKLGGRSMWVRKDRF